jgi:GT2 family glycosyltransferase
MELAFRRQAEKLNSLTNLVERLVKNYDQAQLEAHELQETLISQGMKPPSRSPYQELVHRIRRVVCDHVPRYATIVVASKGDADLLNLNGRVGWHFPATRAGQYAGYYPACSLGAIAQLESLRAEGGEFFLLPATASWWLDHYPAFKLHLEQHYPVVAKQDDTCRIYALRAVAGRTAPSTATGQMAKLLTEFQNRFARSPTILDCQSDLKLEGLFENITIFGPPHSSGPLPYLDHSIDIVLIGAGNKTIAEDARRVAAAVLVEVAHSVSDSELNLDVQWFGGPTSAKFPSISIIVPCFNGARLTQACLESLVQTLPSGLRSEIIVIDDGSIDGTPEVLREWIANARIKVIRNRHNLGFVDSCNLAARESTGEILVFLNNDVIVLPGWLPPLLRAFRDFPKAGAVGGKLIYPDGVLQEAGGIVFCDGSAMNLGRGDTDLDAPHYNFVREVDYCSAALLATRRALFEQLGGFDPEFRPGYYEDTDYCFRVRAKGYRVYYQPASAVVHREGGTAGLDPSTGMKQFQTINRQKFVDRWQEALNFRPPAPSQMSEKTYQALARHRPTEMEGEL